MIAQANEQLDPVQFTKLVWPEIDLYDKQREILYSLRDNEETYVPAGNALGKDFISAIGALWFFCTRRPARVVTTSVKYDQLNDVLWGEIRRLLDTAEIDLPIQYNHLRIRQVRDSDGQLVPLAELVGQVVTKGEALLGRHLPRHKGLPHTLTIYDESSGIEQAVYESSDTWSHRKLIIGNPYPCNNFFFTGVKQGNIPHPTNGHYIRKIIKITAEDSPNVKFAQKEIELGLEPSGKVVIPGVIDYETYLKRRKLWDKVRQCIGLDAEFYEGAESLLFPPVYLNEAASITIPRLKRRITLGIDAGEGGDNTVWAIACKGGLIDLISESTPDTAVIFNRTRALINQYKIDPQDVIFDSGGGGKQHADYLRAKKINVQSIAFGGSATAEIKRGMKRIEERKREDETKYVYKNRRAELYGELSLSLEPERIANRPLFGLPSHLLDRPRPDGGPSLRNQLAILPRQYDAEGRLFLPPKRRTNTKTSTSEPSLIEILGCSPDEADAVALAHFPFVSRKPRKRKIGF